MLKRRSRVPVVVIAALAGLALAVAARPQAASSAAFDVSPPQLSANSAPVGTAIQVSKRFDDDSPAGLAFMYATSGPLQATLGRFVDATALQNRDGQQTRVLTGLITMTEDADSVPEQTLLLAAYRCDAPGLVHFVFGMAAEDGNILSTGSSILVCGTAATPQPQQSVDPPPVPAPGLIPNAALVTEAIPGSQSLVATASFTDDAPSAIVLLSIPRGSEGAGHFRAADLASNKDGQSIDVKGRLVVLGDDADGTAEMTSLTATIDCDAGGPISVVMVMMPATGGLFATKSADVACAGPAVTPAPPPTLSPMPTALPPCAPTPIPGVACRTRPDITSCPTPPGAVLPAVCGLLRPPDTGDAGLMPTANYDEGELR